MPQVQVIDTTETKPEPTGVQNFFSKLSKSYKDAKDRDEIGSLIDQYKNNRADANAWEDLQLGLEKSNISPSKRLQTQASLNEMKKLITEKDKVIVDKANAAQKVIENREKKQEAENKVLRSQEEKEQIRLRKEQDLSAKKEKEESEALQKRERNGDEVEEIMLNAGETPEEAKRLRYVLTPSSALARARDKASLKKVEDKRTEKQKEEDENKEITQNAYNHLVDLIPKVGFGTGALSVFGGENAKSLGEFTSLTGALESLLVERVNRGALSNTRFTYITSTLLPKATDTQNEIRGKLKGLAVILDLDDSKLTGKSSNKKETKDIPEGKVRVKLKGSNPPVYGSVTPYPGMESKYDIINE